VAHLETPDMLVEVGFNLSAGGGPFFTFGSSSGTADNPTSLFDSPTYVFGGTLFYDLTDRVTSVTINRGLSRELDRFTTGSAQLEFVNQVLSGCEAAPTGADFECYLRLDGRPVHGPH
jgi:hypothetical protein